jgi:hypothetical protein
MAWMGGVESAVGENSGGSSQGRLPPKTENRELRTSTLRTNFAIVPGGNNFIIFNPHYFLYLFEVHGGLSVSKEKSFTY